MIIKKKKIKNMIKTYVPLFIFPPIPGSLIKTANILSHIKNKIFKSILTIHLQLLPFGPTDLTASTSLCSFAAFKYSFMSHCFVATAISTGEWSRLFLLGTNYIKNSDVRE